VDDRTLDLEDKIRELYDRIDIESVLIDYCRFLDIMDLDRLVELFTEDCFVDYGPDPGFQSHGRQALKSDLERMWRWVRTSHHLSNVQIMFESKDMARANSYIYAWHERPNGVKGVLLGQYSDVLVRTPEGWKIKQRKQYMNGADGDFKSNINRLQRMPIPPDIDLSKYASI
jgi:3-phenylpropionate/cinnamic acid dioxygenase small subunit